MGSDHAKALVRQEIANPTPPIIGLTFTFSPSFLCERGPESAEAHYGLGGVLIREGRLQEAQPHLQAGLPYLEDLVRTKPGYVDGHYNLGTLYALLGRTDEAIAQFAEAVRLQPDLPEAHMNLGLALAERGRLDEAIDEFAMALRLRPDYGNARQALEEATTRRAASEPRP